MGCPPRDDSRRRIGTDRTAGIPSRLDEAAVEDLHSEVRLDRANVPHVFMHEAVDEVHGVNIVALGLRE